MRAIVCFFSETLPTPSFVLFSFSFSCFSLVSVYEKEGKRLMAGRNGSEDAQMCMRLTLPSVAVLFVSLFFLLLSLHNCFVSLCLFSFSSLLSLSVCALLRKKRERRERLMAGRKRSKESVFMLFAEEMHCIRRLLFFVTFCSRRRSFLLFSSLSVFVWLWRERKRAADGRKEESNVAQ